MSPHRHERLPADLGDRDSMYRADRGMRVQDNWSKTGMVYVPARNADVAPGDCFGRHQWARVSRQAVGSVFHACAGRTAFSLDLFQSAMISELT